MLLSDLLLDLDNSHSVDTWAAIVFSVIFFGTMFPMSTYAGKILLQVCANSSAAVNFMYEAL